MPIRSKFLFLMAYIELVALSSCFQSYPIYRESQHTYNQYRSYLLLWLTLWLTKPFRHSVKKRETERITGELRVPESPIKQSDCAGEVCLIGLYFKLTMKIQF